MMREINNLVWGVPSLVLILCGEVIIIYKYDFVKCILQLSNFAAQPMTYKPDGA